jgi:hypothetical protein
MVIKSKNETETQAWSFEDRMLEQITNESVQQNQNVLEPQKRFP